MAENLFNSGFTPKGVRDYWEKERISNSDAQRIISRLVSVTVVDACAWFNQNGILRVIAAQTDTGQRVIYRRHKRTAEVAIAPRENTAGDPLTLSAQNATALGGKA